MLVNAFAVGPAYTVHFLKHRDDAETGEPLGTHEHLGGFLISYSRHLIPEHLALTISKPFLFNKERFDTPFDFVLRGLFRRGSLSPWGPCREPNCAVLDVLSSCARCRQGVRSSYAHETDDETAQAEERTWNQQIGKRWMIAAVARVYEPGCQVDTILIVEGSQGIGKSSAFRALAVQDSWFACDLPDIKHKDSVHHVLGPWIIELDELDALSRREATSVKGYVSRRTDRARLSYGKLSTNHPRRVAFCGTTNEDTYNTDATGGRRFWPFKVRRAIDVSTIERDRDQLWAEAVHCYRKGHLWHLDEEVLQRIAKAEQDKRFKASPWLDAIEGHVFGKAEIGVSDILTDCLDVPKAQLGQHHMNEVVRCLQHLGWERIQVRRNGKRVRVYVKKEKSDG